MSKVERERKKRCFQNLIKWSQANFSYLPWRQSRSAYTTWISEVMLQQTTVPTVLKRFPHFIQKFPTIKAVAQSKEEEVLKQWQGLGYYRRARNIHQGCQQLKDSHYTLVEDFKELQKIKGIGEYTANAILSFAFEQNALPVDVNVNRVLTRFYAQEVLDVSQVESDISRMKISMRDFAEAVMDCGRVYCQKKATDCLLCPLAKVCQALQKGEVERYPLLVEKKREKNNLVLQRVLFKKNNKIALIQRAPGKWLEGQWELPTFIHSSGEKITQYPTKMWQGEELFRLKSTITHHKIENLVLETNQKIPNVKMVELRQLTGHHLSSVTVKILKKLNLL